MITEARKRSLAKAALKHRYTPLHWATTIRNKALQRAKEKDLEFTLTKDFIYQKILIGKCEVTG